MSRRPSNTFIKPEIPDSIKVFPVNGLSGRVVVPGDKVAGVHLLLATAILQGESRINNIHYCGDVLDIIDRLKSIGLIRVDQYQEYLNITPNEKENYVDLSGLADTRSNVCLVSALALKHKKVIFKIAGGCRFADRKINRHFALMEAFGLKISKLDDSHEIRCTEPSDSVNFDCSTPKYGPSVGVTCHALIASLVYQNKITLTNVALEFAPTTLIEYIKQSTNRRVDIDDRTITIVAVNEVEHEPTEIELPPDITAACTYIAALVSAGNGEMQLENIFIEDIPPSVLEIYREMGVDIIEAGTKRLKIVVGENELQMPKEIICDVFPSFPTDLGPIFAASIAGLSGAAEIIDKIYDRRSSHADGLNKMGYELTAVGNKVTVNGHAPTKKDCVTVKVEDIRSGAALVVGALGSNADSVIITNYKQIYRGYANLIGDLQRLGARIELI